MSSLVPPGEQGLGIGCHECQTKANEGAPKRLGRAGHHQRRPRAILVGEEQRNQRKRADGGARAIGQIQQIGKDGRSLGPSLGGQVSDDLFQLLLRQASLGGRRAGLAGP